jgi:hypothetical protein
MAQLGGGVAEDRALGGAPQPASLSQPMAS